MVPASGSIFSRPHLTVTSAIVATISMNAFSMLAVVAALPPITAELGNVALLSWVITAFLVMSTLATMVAGRVIDSFGVQGTFRLTIVFFTVGSLACALAPSMPALVVFRGVQGAGAGLAFAVATAAIGLAYPERLRPRALAAISVTWGVMAFGAPSIAALFVATTGWRGVFLAMLPIAVGAAILGWARLPARTAGDPTGVPFEPFSVLLLGGFTVVSLIGFSSFSASSLGAVVAALGLGVAYWVHTGRAAQPIIPRRYFAQQPIGATNLAFGLAFGAALGIDAYLPVYVRGGLGYSAVVAAFSVAFLTVGWTLASVVMARLLDRYSETVAALVGYGLLIPPFVIGLVVYDTDTPIALVFGLAFVLGVGVGTLAMSLLNLLYLVSDPQEVGRASSAHQYLRGLFQTYAAALIGAIILIVVGTQLGEVGGVQQLLAGDTVGDVRAQTALATGFRLGHIVPLSFAALGLMVAVRLHRRLGQSVRRAETGT